MNKMPQFNFSYVDLVSQLALYQENKNCNTELTPAILDFFQSQFAENLKTTDAETVIEKIVELPSEPQKKTYIASIHGISDETIQVEIQALTYDEADTLANKGLQMHEWASVKIK